MICGRAKRGMLGRLSQNVVFVEVEQVLLLQHCDGTARGARTGSREGVDE